jgi:hypothetical protein
MLAALGPGGYFVFVLNAVVPDNHGTRSHVEDQDRPGQCPRDVQKIGSHDPQAEPDTHNCETYCQRSDHGGSLAKGKIDYENQTA